MSDILLRKVRNKIFIFAFIVLMLQSNLVAMQQSINAPTNENTLAEELFEKDLIEQLSSLPESFRLAEDSLDIKPQDPIHASADYNILGKLRDNVNEYQQVWTPWLTRAAVHVVEVSDDGEFLVVGGGYLLDTELHVYRWNTDERQYVKVWEVGSGLINRDVYDVAFGDTDANGLIEIAAACADGRVYLFEQAHIIDPVANLENKFDFVWKSDNLFQVSSVEFHDLDLDGTEDLIIGSWDKKVHIYEYTDHSGYPFAEDHWITLTERWVSEELDAQIQALGVGDFNDNGLPDFIVGTHSGSVYVFENDGRVLTSASGVDFPFPNDNNYQQIWNISGDYRPIWRPVLKIATGDLGDNEGTQAVILVPGQGSWVLTYTDERDFFLEQIIKPFEDWQLNEPYPLDYYADWMVKEDGMNWNVFHQLLNGSWVLEPSFADLMINENTGAMGPPNGRYSVFRTNSTATNATGTWNFGIGEELATNGNEEPDLFIVMGDALPTFDKSEWNISLSNDLTNWHQINQTEISITTGSNGSAFAIDVDPLFAVKKMSSAQYVRMTLLGEGQVKNRYLDGFISPWVARPAIAASVTISELPFSYYNQGSTSPKIIFGGVDGRLMAYHYDPQTELVGQYAIWTGKWEFENLYTNFTDEYSIKLAQLSQVWDSFTDDFFNLDTTIWSISETPKKAFIPSWRYIKGSTAEFTNFGIANTVHQMSMAELESSSAGEEFIVSFREHDNLFLRSSTSGGGVGTTKLNQVNAWTDLNGKSLTTSFAEIMSVYSGRELITFPWYRNFAQPTGYDYKLRPIVWVYSSGQYYPWIYLDDVDGYLYNFLATSSTYPSGAAADMNGDGLTDIIVSNGRLAILWNIGTANSPQFKLDTEYFAELNEGVPVKAVFSPQPWDFDQDGDYDIAFSYGRLNNSIRYGMDLFENIGTATSPEWLRNAKIMQNPSIEGSLRFNNYTAGVVIPSNDLAKSAEGLWVYNPVQDKTRYLQAEVDVQSSFIIGTHPELLKLEVNQAQDPNSPNPSLNMGYSMAKSWSNLQEFEDWTLTLTTSYGLDGDNKGEIIVSDYDNNVYVFEHLIENTYKRAFKTHDLNHTVTTGYSPYAFQELPGVSGSFQRTFYDHGNLLAAGLDSNNDGNEEFIVTAGLSIYVFESTGFNDEFKLVFEKDYTSIINDSAITQFTTLAVSPDLDGRGDMIAFAVNSFLYLLRYDPVLGWLESFQPIEGGSGFYGQPGNPDYSPDLLIRALLFADLNQDNTTELWVGGNNESSPDSGFILALQSDYGNIYQTYEFPDFEPRVNVFATTDGDFDGQLELVIGHAYGIDIWEAEEGNTFNLTRIEVISSDPMYGIDPNVTPVFGTYQSSEGLAPRANNILRLATGNYFMAYGIENQSHDPYSGGSMFSNLTIGDGRIYYNLASSPVLGGTLMQNQLFSYTPKPILFNEILYEYWNGSVLDANFTWIELYNPNNFNISLTNYKINNGVSDFVTLSGTIGAGGHYVIAKNKTFFDALTMYPATTANLEWGSYTLDRLGDTLNLKDDSGVIIDSVSWGNIPSWSISANSTTLQRKNITSTWIPPTPVNYPLDTDTVSDWLNTNTTGTPQGAGLESVTPYYLPWEYYILDVSKKQDQDTMNLQLGFETQPVMTQLADGSIFAVWIATYNDSQDFGFGTPMIQRSSAILGRRFTVAGTPLTDTIVIDTVLSASHNKNSAPVGQWYPDVRFTSLGVVSTDNGSIVIGYVLDNPHTSNYHKDLILRKFNPAQIIDTDYYIDSELLYNSSNAAAYINNSLNDYYFHSVDLTSIDADTFALVFSGYLRDDPYPQTDLFYVTLNSTGYNPLKLFKITDTEGSERFPTVQTMAGYSNRLTILYERTSGSTELVSIFSRDGGMTWTDSYVLDTDDSKLHLVGGDLYSENNQQVLNRQLYRPSVADDGTGGFIYQFMARFFVRNDANYAGNLYNHSGTFYTLATNLWVGTVDSGHWFKVDDIKDVRSIAVGDSDNDLRSELFISHDYRVSLLEMTREASGTISHVQVWQYTPPLFLSQHPEQVNSTYTEYLISDTAKHRETGTVAIFDSNGNGWAELIFTVRGGDVFAFEITDLAQPINEKVFLTTTAEYSNASLVPSSDHLLITEVFYDPLTSYEERWIELYNPTATNISLIGWELYSVYLDDPFSLSGTINASGYFIIAQNSTAFQALYSGSPDLTWGASFDMWLLGDTIEVRDQFGTTIDSISYKSYDPEWPLTSVETSLRRLSLVDTDSYTDWEDSETIGDPGTGIYLITANASDNLLVDVNGDNQLDLVVASDKYGHGIVAWNLATDSLLWHYPTPGMTGNIHFFNDSAEEPVIVGITTSGVFGVNLNGTRRYWVPGAVLNTTNNHAFADVTSDSLAELIIATIDDIRTINPFTGEDVWQFRSNPDNNTVGYFGLVAGKLGNSTVIAVSSSDFATYQNVHVLNSSGHVIKTLDITQYTSIDNNTQLAIGDFDGNIELDLAIASFNIYNTSVLSVIDISSEEVIFNQTLPVLKSMDFAAFPMFARDVDQDGRSDLIISIPTFSSSLESMLIPNNNYASAIVAIDVASTSLHWNRYFLHSLKAFKSLNYGTGEILFAYTDSSGIYGISVNGADVIWAEANSDLVAASIAKDSTTGITLVAVTYTNGTGPISEVMGALEGAANVITPQMYTVKTNVGTLYPELSVENSVIPIKMTLDGRENLLIAFTNGTLILRSFEEGELWRVDLSPFSDISASGLEIEPNLFGLAFTNSTDLFILRKTTNLTWTEIKTTASIVTAFSLNGLSDVLLLQDITGPSSTISIFDPITQNFIWNYTSASYFTNISGVSLDPSQPGQYSHIFTLDYLGTARLVELPSTSILGGTFPAPNVGTKWIETTTVENNDQLSDLYLLSDSKELVRYRWHTSGTISMISYNCTNEIETLTAVNQGAYTEVLLNTKYNGSIVLRDNGTAISELVELGNKYIDSYDHQFVNIDNLGEEELAIIVGNALVLMTSEGTVIETHSFSSDVVQLMTWIVDSSYNPMFVAVLKDMSISVVDPSGRSLDFVIAEEESIEYVDLRTDIGRIDLQSDSNNEQIYQIQMGTTNLLRIQNQVILLVFTVTIGTILAVFMQKRKRRRNINDRRV